MSYYDIGAQSEQSREDEAEAEESFEDNQDPSIRYQLPKATVLKVGQWDHRAFAWVARRRSKRLDYTMPRLTHLCDDGRLWAWLAVIMALLGGKRGRRAARAGLLSLAIASPLVNGPIKWIVRRPRPPIEIVPKKRRIKHRPRTTSFPSGHSASAFCFSTAASIEAPILAPVLMPLAAIIAYSRVYTGARYPADAVAGSISGAALGAGLGETIGQFGPRGIDWID